jgi:hypothetical protein
VVFGWLVLGQHNFIQVKGKMRIKWSNQRHSHLVSFLVNFLRKLVQIYFFKDVVIGVDGRFDGIVFSNTWRCVGVFHGKGEGIDCWLHVYLENPNFCRSHFDWCTKI